MIKRNKWKLLITSVIILLPIAVGLFLWNDLPEQIPVHWGIQNTPDRWSGKGFAVFAIPLFLLAVHWVCVIGTAADPKNRDQSPKAMGLIFWIVPFVSLFVSGFAYAAAMGMIFGPGVVVPVIAGIAFMAIGNYLPKCKPNYTLGIKVAWTLNSEVNWIATHRLAGKVWMIGGALLLLCVFLPQTAAAYAVAIDILALAAIPIIYSYAFYRKHEK